MEKRHFKRVVIPGTYNPENQIAPLILTDPFGSYTGMSVDPYEKPVQDADDL